MKKIYKICDNIEVNVDYVHITLIVLRNKVLVISTNNTTKTHPKNKKFGYKYDFLHSELGAIIKNKAGKRHKMINIRLTKKRRWLNSKPCAFCGKMLCSCFTGKIYFSTENGFKEYIY